MNNLNDLFVTVSHWTAEPIGHTDWSALDADLAEFYLDMQQSEQNQEQHAQASSPFQQQENHVNAF